MNHLGRIVEANVALDKGGPELARVVLIDDDNNAHSFQMEQDVAHELALNLSRDVWDTDSIVYDLDTLTLRLQVTDTGADR